MNINKDNIGEYVHTRHLLGSSRNDNYSIEELGGGFLNTVLRVSNGPHSIVVKQAIDSLRLFPDLKVTTERINYETNALRLLDNLYPSGTVPSVLYFDDKNHILVMSDLGRRQSLETELVEGIVNLSVAKRLGQFLGSLHRETWINSELREQFNNAAMQDLRYKYCFYFVEDSDLNKIAYQLSETFTATKQTLLHGDFWTASIITTEERVHTFDLEFVNYGHPAQDVGFIIAHYLLHAYNNPSLTVDIFKAVEYLWGEYKKSMGRLLLDVEDMEKAVIRQAGLEMLFRIDGINQVNYISDNIVKTNIRDTARLMMIDENPSVLRLKNIEVKPKSVGQ